MRAYSRSPAPATLLLACCTASLLSAAGSPFQHDIRPGPGVTSEYWLSRYAPSLAASAGDTKVFVMNSSNPGGTALVVGGTHGNEIAGIMAAILLVERASLSTGRLIVIPHANNSAISYTDPLHPGPEWTSIATPGGARKFKYGARRTRPDDQGAPDPPTYRHPSSSEALDGEEARNLDRVYPGNSQGTLTERIAAAIVTLIVEERVDVAFDLHEAGPESRLAWMIVAHPKNVDVGALAVLALEERGIKMNLEPSSATFRGLSHREWGDATAARAFLFETPNPGQVDGGLQTDTLHHPTYPLARRVGVHLEALRAVLDAYDAEAQEAARIDVAQLPSLEQLLRDGLGAFLR
ncbi:MAG: succinylglutamate desuccinylase/aspartoacylase family protein [Vicinamibacterales bacterium]